MIPNKYLFFEGKIYKKGGVFLAELIIFSYVDFRFNIKFKLRRCNYGFKVSRTKNRTSRS
jgi:hypothetical protein